MIVDEPEVKIETDEQKFTRELNESCSVDDILHRVKNLDEHMELQLQEAGLVEGFLKPTPTPSRVVTSKGNKPSKRK